MIENIDCIAFKRDCGADPQSIVANSKLLNHQNACAPCAGFYQSMLALDLKLSAAFDLPIHEATIEDQLSATQVYKQANNVITFRKPNLQKIKPMFAAAASVLIAAFGVFALQYPATAFANEVVEHIYHEPDLLMLNQAVTDQDKIDMVLKQANVTFSGKQVEVLFAKLCPLDEQLAAHLIVRGESGNPISVFILPGDEYESREINTKEFNGRILPAEHGTIAVVGGKKENLDTLEKAVLNTFQWRD